MKMTHSDFEHLCETHTKWHGQNWEIQDGRFEVSSGNYDDPINFEFAHAYWVGDNYLNVILAREYLTARGYADHQVLWDMADNTSEWYWNKLQRLCQAAVGGEGTQDTDARVQALTELAETLRGENHSYVVLSNFGIDWNSPERIDTAAYVL
jgi:hypothetical protein